MLVNSKTLLVGRARDLWRTTCSAGAWISLILLALPPPAQAGEPDWNALSRTYEQDLRPLMRQYCHSCHSAQRSEADIDFQSLATFSEARRHAKTWERVAEMISDSLMPPADAPQPTAAERARLQAWVREFLAAEARSRVGDPGPVVLRRLSNAEYTYTLRDLTGVGSLDPAREFPVDGAAGEGFTNAGNALTMSPTLITKYLDAAKEVAAHAVLLPDGFRFSPHTTRADWTNDTLARIHELYRQFTDAAGGNTVNLQGIVFDTNQGGRLPVEKYLAATLAEREALTRGQKTIEAVARERGLSAKYLGGLWKMLAESRPNPAGAAGGSAAASFLLDGLRARWRDTGPNDVSDLAADIARWQQALWRFNSVGHIGKLNGPKTWMEPVDPCTARQDFKLKPPAASAAGPNSKQSAEVVLYLAAGDAGDGNEQDFVVWERPRLVAPGRPDVLLRDVHAVASELAAQRAQLSATAAQCLDAAAEASAGRDALEVSGLAKRRGVAAELLAAWLNYLGVGAGGPVKPESLIMRQSSQPASGSPGQVVPAGSLLARWQTAVCPDEQRWLADELQRLLQEGVGTRPPEAPDSQLYRQLTSLDGPLISTLWRAIAARPPGAAANGSSSDGLSARFGKHPNGGAAGSVDSASMCVQAPSVVQVRLPSDLAAGAEFVTTGTLHAETGREGSAQLQILITKPEAPAGLQPIAVEETNAGGPWTSNDRGISYARPIVVADGSAARLRFEAAFADFRTWFPAALCYAKIVPVDEVITLTLFYREDEHLRRLMLDDAQSERLDRLWDELHFVSQDALKLVDAFEQLWQYATQDADPKVFEPMRQPIHERAAAFLRRLGDAEPRQLDALVEFAARVYRRPLAESESRGLRDLYDSLRRQELPHDEAFRLVLARLFVSPAFLYRAERIPAAESGRQPAAAIAQPVSDVELATRLSYFLWSSVPDEALRESAAGGRLQQGEELIAQARRMLKDPRVCRLAAEFATQWLHIYQFDAHDEKSPAVFPTFASLRGAMHEEFLRFFTDMVQRDGSILELLDADHTFLNEDLARHYGIPGVTGPHWRRVEGMREQGRGGILGMAAPLAKQAGASRTSPILRGNWVSEVLLGEKTPRPPNGVPQLPETVPAGLTERQLTELHTAEAACAKCHARIDPFGFTLEGFDAIGRTRRAAPGVPPLNTRAKLFDGAEVDGLDGLRSYLLTTRREQWIRFFCRKLLGYSLGRAVQLSDEPLLDDMMADLKANDYRFGAAVEAIVRSPQFRNLRVAFPEEPAG